MKVSSKVIKKVEKNAKSSWSHDKCVGGAQSIKFTVFLRNLPEKVNAITIANLLTPADAALVIGIKVKITIIVYINQKVWRKDCWS